MAPDRLDSPKVKTFWIFYDDGLASGVRNCEGIPPYMISLSSELSDQPAGLRLAGNLEATGVLEPSNDSRLSCTACHWSGGGDGLAGFYCYFQKEWEGQGRLKAERCISPRSAPITRRITHVASGTARAPVFLRRAVILLLCPAQNIGGSRCSPRCRNRGNRRAGRKRRA